MKNLLKAAMVALLLTPLVGCGPKGSEKQGSNTTETHGKKYNVAYLVNGNLGDKSFFDSAAAGLKTLEEDIKMISEIEKQIAEASAKARK